jgi:hypothetical protein
MESNVERPLSMMHTDDDGSAVPTGLVVLGLAD